MVNTDLLFSTEIQNDDGEGVCSLRFFKKEDLKSIYDYFMNSPDEFLERIGFNLNFKNEENKFLKLLNQSVSKYEKKMIMILKNQNVIGYFLYSSEDQSVHCHLFFDQDRGKHIVRNVALAAVKVFFKKFELSELNFEASVENLAVHKLLQSFGLRVCETKEKNENEILSRHMVHCYKISKEALG